MARLREADLQVGDHLRYTERKGTTYVGHIEGIERIEGVPALALFTCDGQQLILRLGKLARFSTRVRKPAA